MPRWPGFVGPSYQSLASMLNGERTMNLIPEIVAPEAPFAKARGMLYSCPGIVDFVTAGDTPGRGFIREDSGRPFAVFGSEFGEIVDGPVWTPRGTVAVDTQPAQLVTNGNDELLVVSGSMGYVLTLSDNTFALEVSDVTMCGALDTFFLGLDAVSGIFKISEAGDGRTWDPGQVVARSAMPDPWKALSVARKEIALIGPKSGEVWFNDGGSPFPFSLREGSVFDVGIEASFTLVPFAGTWAWLGSGERGGLGVYMLNGYDPIKISTIAIDRQLLEVRERYGLEDTVAWTCDRLGHSFYVLDLPRVGKTFVYDQTTQQWHERGRWNVLDNNYVHYRPRFYTEAMGFGLVLDGEGSKVYRFSESVYTDAGGGPLRVSRRVPLLPTDNQRTTIDYLEFEAQRGVGLQQGQGSDPQLMVRMSFDGGSTWGNERTVDLGKAGKFDARIIKHKWGSGRNPCVEVACTDPVPVRLFDLYYGAS